MPWTRVARARKGGCLADRGTDLLLATTGFDAGPATSMAPASPGSSLPSARFEAGGRASEMRVARGKRGATSRGWRC
jgi:hypothetical protein